MRSVLMDIDMGFGIVAGIAVAAYVIAFFNDQNFFAGYFYFVCENSAEKTSADYQEIIHDQVRSLSSTKK